MKKIPGIFFLVMLLLCIPTVTALDRTDDIPRWGPYVTADDAHTVTIHYRLWEEGPGAAELTANNTTIRIAAPSALHHHLTLTNLTPDTVYQYRVLVQNSWSESYQFRTFGAETYSFVISGDTRSEPPFTQKDRHGIVAAAILTENPLFVVHLGDFCGDARDLNEWDLFFDAGRNLYANTIIVPVQGNHDEGPLYSEIFGKPDWYAFSAGNLTCLVLNTNGWTATRFDNQTTWLTGQLAQPGTKIALFHHPFYTTDQKRSGLSTDRKEIWQNLFSANHVPAAYSAHMHAYERYCAGNVAYVTNGAGGAPLYPPERESEIEPVSAVYHTLGYVRVTVSGDRFVSTFLLLAKASDDNSILTTSYPPDTYGDLFDSADPGVAAAPMPTTAPAGLFWIPIAGCILYWRKL